MFQGRQRYCEDRMRNFMDKYGSETEKAYLRNIVAQRRIAGHGGNKGKKNQIVPIVVDLDKQGGS